jgi:DNA mismatch repair protein MSH4
MRSDTTVNELILDIRESSAQLFRICESIALADMMASFAHLSTIRDYVRPEMRDTFALKAARHPLLDNASRSLTTEHPGADAYSDFI